MMWLFCSQMWGLPLERQVERRCVLIWLAFLCFSALLWVILCAFTNVDTSSMMCGTWNGVGVVQWQGTQFVGVLRVCSSVLCIGKFLCWLGGFIFDVRLLATMVGGALLTLWMSGIGIWLPQSFTLCFVCSSTLCSGLGGGSAIEIRKHSPYTSVYSVTLLSYGHSSHHFYFTHPIPVHVVCVPTCPVALRFCFWWTHILNYCCFCTYCWTVPMCEASSLAPSIWSEPFRKSSTLWLFVVFHAPYFMKLLVVYPIRDWVALLIYTLKC